MPIEIQDHSLSTPLAPPFLGTAPPQRTLLALRLPRQPLETHLILAYVPTLGFFFCNPLGRTERSHHPTTAARNVPETPPVLDTTRARGRNAFQGDAPHGKDLTSSATLVHQVITKSTGLPAGSKTSSPRLLSIGVSHGCIDQRQQRRSARKV